MPNQNFLTGNRSAELEARRAKRQRLAENSDDSDEAASRLLAERQAQKETRGGKSAAAKRPKPKKAYIPEKNSGSYALLVGLLLHLPDYLQQPLPPLNTDDPEAHDVREDHIMQHLMRCQLTKSDLMSAANDHCRVSMFASENGGFHTGWSAMKTLNTKELVLRRGNPPRFHLSREGYQCAVSVWQAANAEKGFPHVNVPIEAMGGFQYAVPPADAQAGPGPRTAAAHAARRTDGGDGYSALAGPSRSRPTRAENAYRPILDDLDFLDDAPHTTNDYDCDVQQPNLAPGRRDADYTSKDTDPAPILDSSTVKGLQFWYIGKSCSKLECTAY